MDFGLDSAFLQEEFQLTPEAEQPVRANVQKLVEFTSKIGKELRSQRAAVLVGVGGEIWRRSCIARLQKLQ